MTRNITLENTVQELTPPPTRLLAIRGHTPKPSCLSSSNALDCSNTLCRAMTPLVALLHHLGNTLLRLETPLLLLEAQSRPPNVQHFLDYPGRQSTHGKPRLMMTSSWYHGCETQPRRRKPGNAPSRHARGQCSTTTYVMRYTEFSIPLPPPPPKPPPLIPTHSTVIISHDDPCNYLTSPHTFTHSRKQMFP